MEESCHAEQCQHEPENEREVHRLPEIDQRGRDGRPVRASLGNIPGNVGLALRTGSRPRQDDGILTGNESTSAGILLRSGWTHCVQIAGQREGRAGAESAAGVAGERRRPDDAK